MSSGTVSGGNRRGMIAAVVAAVAVVAVAVLVLTNCRGGSSSRVSTGSQGGASTSASSTEGAAALPAAPQPPQGMAKLALADLPAEAQDVVDKLVHGGGFKYRQDGTTFSNREQRLPPESHGYYREYTVTTPGASDRGPRRLIVGKQGELYYTSDHYRTFQWVVRGSS